MCDWILDRENGRGCVFVSPKAWLTMETRLIQQLPVLLAELFSIRDGIGFYLNRFMIGLETRATLSTNQMQN